LVLAETRSQHDDDNTDGINDDDDDGDSDDGDE
jgi:hypothetical protein